MEALIALEESHMKCLVYLVLITWALSLAGCALHAGEGCTGKSRPINARHHEQTDRRLK